MSSQKSKNIFRRKRGGSLPVSLILLILLAAVLYFVPASNPDQIFIPATLTATTPGYPTKPAAPPPELPTLTPLPLPTGSHGGRIIFTCTRGDFNQLCLVNRDGSGLLQLTDEYANNYYPVFSPRGEAVAFASNRSQGTFDLYLLVFSTSKVIPLTDEIGNVFSPDFSPDGEKLLFINRRDSDPTELWEMNQDGSAARLLFGGPRYAGPNTLVGAAWSPNGKRIALAMTVNQPYEYEIFLMDADGESPPQRLTQGLLGIGGSLNWSPDGRYLLIVAGPPGDKDIFRLDADTGAVARLTRGGNNNSPAYSPDSEWIVFNSLRNGGQADLFLMRADGSDLRQLTNHPEPDWQPEWEP